MRGPRWLLGLLVLAGFLAAVDGTAGVIEERQALMRALGDDLQAIWDGLARGEGAAVERGARQIATQAARILTLFPPDSFHPPSRAQPAIPEELRTFEGFARDLRAAAEEVAGSVRQGALTEVQPHLRRLVQTCRQCHRSYVKHY